MIHVLIGDDHPVVRAGLEQLLANAPDMELVGSAADGDQVVLAALELSPDVVLLDLSMPVKDGIEVAHALVQAGSAARIVILTLCSDNDRMLEVLDAGAIGYLFKDAPPDELLNGVRAAARDEAPIAPRAARALLAARVEDAGRVGPEELLSERELEVLCLVAGGVPNKLVGRELGISEKTVKAHLTRIYRQVGVTDRVQAGLWAMRHGLCRDVGGRVRVRARRF